MSVTFLTNEDKALIDQQIGELSEEMAGKMSAAEYTTEVGSSVVSVEFFNAMLTTNAGVFTEVENNSGMAACRDFIHVLPSVAYTFDFVNNLSPNLTYAYIDFYAEADESTWISRHVDYGARGKTKFIVPQAAGYLRIYLLMSNVSYDAVKPRDMLLYVTGTEPVLEGTRVIATKKLDVPSIHKEMVAQGLVDGGRVIPAYYNSYLPDKINRVTELYDACAGNGDAFFFVTDQHWESNAQHSPALIGHISEKVNIPRVFCGGDMYNGINADYLARMAADVKCDIYHAVGNHEYNKNTTGHMLCRVLDSGKGNQIGNPLRHYYYVDNHQQKIRYVVLSPFDLNPDDGSNIIGYEAEQIAWVTSEALDLTADWTVVVFSHALYYPNKTDGTDTKMTPWPTGAADIVAALDAAVPDVACVLQGHIHLDRVAHTPGGIPVVATVCDKYMPWMSGETNNEPWLSASRTEGTITEQAFDAVVLDKTARKLTFVRIGAPADDWTDGVSTGTVEERAVTY